MDLIISTTILEIMSFFWHVIKVEKVQYDALCRSLAGWIWSLQVKESQADSRKRDSWTEE